MRSGTEAAGAPAAEGKRDMLLRMLVDLLPPEHDTEGDDQQSQRDTFHAFVLLANLIDARSGRILLPLMKMVSIAVSVSL